MSDFLNLEIAGVNFLITAANLKITRHADPAYQHFFMTDRVLSADIDIKIKIHLIPHTHAMDKIFDSGESWSLCRSDNDYFLIFQPPVFKEPYLVARMNDTLTQVVIYCSEHLITHTGNTTTVLNPVQYPLDQIILMHYLAQRQGALIHAAGIDIDGCGYIFPGRSGAGKSTLSRQFFNRKDFQLLSDDRIIVRKTAEPFTAYGTPWPGDEGIAANRSAHLSGIFFLSHGDANRIEEIKPQKSLEQLLAVTSVPWYEEESMMKVLTFCEDLTANVPSYNFQFKPDTQVPDFFHTFLSELPNAKSL